MSVHTIHVPGDREPWIETSDGRTFGMNTPEGRAYAKSNGVRQVFIDPQKGAGNTPPQDHIGDPLAVDPRDIRLLSTEEREAVSLFVRSHAYASIAHRNWRGRDRWIYSDVLGVGRTPKEASVKGTPVGPIDNSWFNKLRMVGDQLALRILSPR